MRTFLWVLACLNWMPTAFGQAPAKTVSVTVDMISVPRAEAFELVRLNSAAKWERVIQMVKVKAAKSEFLGRVAMGDGERAIVECFREIRYPSEFQTGELLDFGSASSHGVPLMSRLDLQICPTFFEVRNTGISLEVLPRVLNDGIELEIIPSRTGFRGFTNYPNGAEETLLTVRQPLFRTNKLQTKILVQPGKPLFLGAGELEPGREGDDGKMVLMFITAVVSKK